MLLIPNALCWSSRKCNCTCALRAEVQLCLRVTRKSWQKLFAGKNFVKILVTVQTQFRSHSEQQRAFGNSNICHCYVMYTAYCLINAFQYLGVKAYFLRFSFYIPTWWIWSRRWRQKFKLSIQLYITIICLTTFGHEERIRLDILTRKRPVFRSMRIVLTL